MWIDELRQTGIDRFAAVGFPSNKEEEWRFTSVRAIAETAFVAAPVGDAGVGAAEVAAFSFGEDAAIELVFVNGQYSAGLSAVRSLPRGVRVGSIAEVLGSEAGRLEPYLGRLAEVDGNPFVALNTGNIGDGAFVQVARGTVIEKPIHLLFLSRPGERPTASHPRVVMVFEDSVQATIVESYAGAGAGVYLTNAVTEIVAGNNCRIDHCKMQQEGLAAFHVATMQTKLGRDTQFVSHSASLGGRLTRNDLNVLMAGEGAYATLNGLVLIGGNQHVDNHTLLDHAVPNCPSHELYKHVLGGKATGVFKGKILVRQDAQKTDSKQTSKSLLLSDDAVMNSQPALEIYADDVKCTHGSTIGPVDEEMVFYLRSRGVSLEAARHLLSYAFAADVTRRIKVEPVRRRLEEFMAAQHGLPQDLRITGLGAHDEKAR